MSYVNFSLSVGVRDAGKFSNYSPHIHLGNIDVDGDVDKQISDSIEVVRKAWTAAKSLVDEKLQEEGVIINTIEEAS